MKQRLRKAKRLIKKFQDSWGSLEHRFKHRQIKRLEVKEAREELEELAKAGLLPTREKQNI